MSTVISTVLIVSPPAFLTGWLLSKALFRQIALRHAQAERSRAAAAPTTAVQGDQTAVRKLLTDRQRSQQLIQQLREQLAAAELRSQPLQGEVQLLKEAVAEREHQITELRRKLQLQSSPPELAVRHAATVEAAADRQLLQATRDALVTQEQRANEQAAQLTAVTNRLQNAARRTHKWRTKAQPLLRQFRQQRTMIQQLREELRQRDLPQPVAEGVSATHFPASTILIQSTEPALRNAGRSDYSNINQENLQVLRGLGPALHKKLNERGIYRLGQLAEMTEEESYRLCRSLGVAHKTAERNNWSAGARELLGMIADTNSSDLAPSDLN